VPVSGGPPRAVSRTAGPRAVSRTAGPRAVSRTAAFAKVYRKIEARVGALIAEKA